MFNIKGVDKMKEINLKIGMFIMVLFLLCLMSCVGTSTFTPSEKVAYTSVQTLKVAKQFRTTGLESAKILWDQGLLDVKTKDKIVQVADDLQMAINDCADALKIYLESGGNSGGATLEEKLKIYHKLYGQFTDLVMPFIIKKMEG